MLIETFAIWPNKGQAKLAIAGSNLTGVDTVYEATRRRGTSAVLFFSTEPRAPRLRRPNAIVQDDDGGRSP